MICFVCRSDLGLRACRQVPVYLSLQCSKLSVSYCLQILWSHVEVEARAGKEVPYSLLLVCSYLPAAKCVPVIDYMSWNISAVVRNGVGY